MLPNAQTLFTHDARILVPLTLSLFLHPALYSLHIISVPLSNSIHSLRSIVFSHYPNPSLYITVLSGNDATYQSAR